MMIEPLAVSDAWGLRGKFDLFGPAHLGVFLVMVIVLVVMVRVARNPAQAQLCRKLDLALAMVVLWSYPAKILSRYYGDVEMAVPLLPMQFCDWASIAAFFALVLRSYRMAELTYYWAMAGTLQGLVTPTITVGFPHPAWFAFFQLHGGVVLVALYLVFGQGLRPRKGAVLRVFVMANLYAIVAGVVNLLSVNNNYGFLRSKPPSGSMLDILGPWPIYIFWMQVAALIVFTIFDIPFWRGRKRRARAEAERDAI